MELDNEIIIRDQLISGLLPSLKILKSFGADYLGYRYFKDDGSSFGFTTNDKWYINKKTEQFFEAQRKHLERELQILLINKLSYVTRSREQTESEYMKLLDERGMSNSVGIYRFFPKKAEHYFFISSSAEPFFRDKIINHLNDLEILVNNISPIIEKTILEAKIKLIPEFFLSKETIDFIFKNNNNQSKLYRRTSFAVNGEEKNFTQRECEVLGCLSFGMTNKVIANKLNISSRTVEKFIENLKHKFNCNREKLVKIANQKELQSILIEKI